MGIFQYDCICGNSIEEILKVALPKVKCKCGKYARKIVWMKKDAALVMAEYKAMLFRLVEYPRNPLDGGKVEFYSGGLH